MPKRQGRVTAFRPQRYGVVLAMRQPLSNVGPEKTAWPMTIIECLSANLSSAGHGCLSNS